MSDRMKSDHEDDLPTYGELFGHQGNPRSPRANSTPSSLRAPEEITLYEVLGQFFTYTKETDAWAKLGGCKLALVQAKVSRETSIIITRKRTKVRYVEHPLSAVKAMRAHNACGRSRVWSVRDGGGGGKGCWGEKSAVFCFRCPSPEVAQELEAAYYNAHSMCTAHLSPIFSTEGRLFVLPEGTRSWRPRGRVTVSFMQHPQTREVRLVVEHGRTGRTVVNEHVAACTSPLVRSARGRARTWHVASGARDRRGDEPGRACCLRLADVQLAEEFEMAFEDARRHDATRTLVSANTTGNQSVEEEHDGMVPAKPVEDLKSGGTTALPPPPEYDDIDRQEVSSRSTQAAPPSYPGPSANGPVEPERILPLRRFSRTLSRFLGGR